MTRQTIISALDIRTMARHAAPVSIGTALQEEVVRRGVSHDEAAEIVGVSQATFSRWARADNIPAPRYWLALARFLRIPKEQVGELCAKERNRRGNRGVRGVSDDVVELKREVAELRRLVLRLLERD